MRKTGSPVEGYAEGEEPLVYHYGRPGERLRNADESVRQFYEEAESRPRRGILRYLVQTRTSRVLLIAIAALAVMNVALAVMGGDSSASVAGIPLGLSAFSFGDGTYVSLRLSPAEGESGPAVEVAVRFQAYAAEDRLVHEEDSAGFYLGQELFLRTSFPDYDIVYVKAVVTASGGSATLRCDVTKN